MTAIGETAWKDRMDVTRILQDLQAHLENVNRTIAALEAIHSADPDNITTPRAKRRGRKCMGAEERQQVSLRMKRYWSDRRNQSQQRSA
jgi:hypothetical protein